MEQVKQQCRHPEAHVSGLVDDKGNLYTLCVNGHDCDYVESRNALIPFAEAKANKTAGSIAPKGDDARHAWCGSWNRTFFAEMIRLWTARCEGVGKMQRAAA